MTTSISDYTCNLIAGRELITNLYYAVDRARAQRNNGLLFCYKVSFKGIGTKTYTGTQLMELDNRAANCSMAKLLSDIVGVPTLDQFILVLLKARNDIQTLYQTRYRAMYIRSAAKMFCYTFVNPFGSYAGVSSNKLSFRVANKFLEFFDGCLCGTFDALLVLAGAPVQVLGN